MSDDEEKCTAASEVAAQTALATQIPGNQSPYPPPNVAPHDAAPYYGSGFQNDIHCRSTALDCAMRLSKPGDPFPDVIGKARAIYAFLTDKGVAS